MDRICPECENIVNSPKALFCYFCGTQLEEQQVEVAILKEEKSSPKKRYSKRFILLFVTVPIIFIGFFTYYKFFASKKPVEQFSSPVEEEQSLKFEIDLSNEKISLPSGSLATKALSQIVPVSVSTFVVLNEPGEVYRSYVEEKSEIDVSELTDLTVDEVASFLEPSFGLAFRNDSFAFIAKMKNKEFIEKKVSEISTNEVNIYIEVVDDYLVITNDVNLLNEIQNVNKELSLSLASDAFFVESTKDLSSDGAALVFFRDLNQVKLLLENLVSIEKFEAKGRNAFVVKKSGDGVVLQF